MSFHGALSWAGKHPFIVAAGVFIGGFVILNLLGAFSGSSSGSSSGANSDAGEVGDYFAAESAQAQAGDEVDIAQISAQAGTAQTALNDNATEAVNTTWANADTAINASNNATTVAVAPYSAVGAIAQALSGVTEQTVTSESTGAKVGFGPFSVSTPATKTVAPSPAAVEAGDTLSEALGNFLA